MKPAIQACHAPALIPLYACRLWIFGGNQSPLFFNNFKDFTRFQNQVLVGSGGPGKSGPGREATSSRVS